MADDSIQTDDQFDEEFLKVVLRASLESVDQLIANLGVQGARRHIRSLVMGQLHKEEDDSVEKAATASPVTCAYCRQQYSINHDYNAYMQCVNTPCTPP